MNSIKKLSRTTGLTYLLMAPLGVLGILYVPNMLFVTGDIAATIDNIVQNQNLIHISVLSSIIVQLIQIILVLLLFKLFKNVSKTAAVLMVAFIIPAVSIAMLNEVNYLAISSLLGGAAFSTYFSVEQIQGLVELLISMHTSGVMIAQIFWGIWLFPMGYLVYKSGFVPKIIGALLMIGCFGYLSDSVFFILNFDIGFTVSEYTFIGEVLLPLWLLFKAKSVEEKYNLRFPV